MTSIEFVTKIQKYYSDYKPVVLVEVNIFLSCFSSSTLDELFEFCKLKYSNTTPNSINYTPPPDVAKLNQIIDEAIIKAHKKDKSMKRMQQNRSDPVISEEEKKKIEELFDNFRKKYIDQYFLEEQRDILQEKKIKDRKELLQEQARKLEKL